MNIKGSNGKKWSAEVELAKGKPENPATWEDIYTKFRSNAMLLIHEEEVEKLGQTVMDLEHASVDDLMERL